MNDSQTYERILKMPRSARSFLPRLGLIFGYLLALSFLILLAAFLQLSAGALLLIPLVLLLLILPTWKYGSVEYEYIFGGGMFYFSKIYGKRKRKQLLALDLSQAGLIAPNDEEHRHTAERMSPDQVIHATVNDRAEDIWLIVYETPDKKTAAVLFHADERTVRLLRRANPHATVRLPFSHLS